MRPLRPRRRRPGKPSLSHCCWDWEFVARTGVSRCGTGSRTQATYRWSPSATTSTRGPFRALISFASFPFDCVHCLCLSASVCRGLSSGYLRRNFSSESTSTFLGTEKPSGPWIPSMQPCLSPRRGYPFARDDTFSPLNLKPGSVSPIRDPLPLASETIWRWISQRWEISCLQQIGEGDMHPELGAGRSPPCPPRPVLCLSGYHGRLDVRWTLSVPKRGMNVFKLGTITWVLGFISLQYRSPEIDGRPRVKQAPAQCSAVQCSSQRSTMRDDDRALRQCEMRWSCQRRVDHGLATTTVAQGWGRPRPKQELVGVFGQVASLNRTWSIWGCTKWVGQGLAPSSSSKVGQMGKWNPYPSKTGAASWRDA